jgi:hypothetical protein
MSSQGEAGDPSSKNLNTENDLIHHRLSWLLASQSLLFMAYASLLSSEDSREIAVRVTAMKAISFLGLSSAVSVLIGVVGAIIAFVVICRKNNRPLGVTLGTTILGFVPAVTIPLVSAIVWFKIYSTGG